MSIQLFSNEKTNQYCFLSSICVGCKKEKEVNPEDILSNFTIHAKEIDADGQSTVAIV